MFSEQSQQAHQVLSIDNDPISSIEIRVHSIENSCFKFPHLHFMLRFILSNDDCYSIASIWSSFNTLLEAKGPLNKNKINEVIKFMPQYFRLSILLTFLKIYFSCLHCSFDTPCQTNAFYIKY